MEAKSTKLKTIPLLETQDWLKEWQGTNKTSAKAFLIPASDLIGMLKEMGVVTENTTTGVLTVNSTVDQDIRAYIGLDPDKTNRIMKEGYGNRLFMVGTTDVGGIHKDIVEKNTGVDLSKMTGTGIFDFATPCPNDCDTLSPLYDPK